MSQSIIHYFTMSKMCSVKKTSKKPSMRVSMSQRNAAEILASIQKKAEIIPDTHILRYFSLAPTTVPIKVEETVPIKVEETVQEGPATPPGSPDLFSDASSLSNLSPVNNETRAVLFNVQFNNRWQSPDSSMDQCGQRIPDTPPNRHSTPIQQRFPNLARLLNAPQKPLYTTVRTRKLQHLLKELDNVITENCRLKLRLYSLK